MSRVGSNVDGALFAEERQRDVLERLHSTGKVTVEELATAFHVSAPTVRADLTRLEDQGLLRRTHGGAIPISHTLYEPPYAQRQVMRYDEKRAIARLAASRVKDGETVMLDAGTTTHEIAILLKERTSLTVVTNSLVNALTLMDSPDIAVILVGGNIQPRRKATLGPLAVRFLEAFRVDRAFMGFNGVHVQSGYTVVDFDAAEIKRRMMACAGEVVAVADSSKIGQIAFAAVAPLQAANFLITDDQVTPENLQQLIETGLQVLTTSI